MKKILTLCLALLIAVVASAREVYLFAYFVGEKDGLHLAYSYDGLQWTALNNNQSLLTPTVGKDKLMRDPSIVQGPDGTFHMVWTSSWYDRIIGYASSKDLIHWSEQRALPVMEHEPTALNCWAPELYYDAKSGEFYIFWATTIPGRHSFVPTSEREKQWNHRIYCTTTKDFKDFSPVRLWFNPTFSAIDAAIAYDKQTKEHIMVIKNENSAPAEKNIRVTRTKDMKKGFPTKVSASISGDYWCEGPAPLFVGNRLYVYFDRYRDHKYGVLCSEDHGKTWKEMSDQLSLPKGIRHGTAFAVEESVLDNMLSTTSIASPDGKTIVKVNANGGVISYAIEHDGKQLMAPSRLGLNTTIGDFTQGLALQNVATRTVQSEYDLSRSKVSHVKVDATETDLTYKNEAGAKMTVTFHVSANDVAFRYSFPKQRNDEPKNVIVHNETTSFNFLGNTTTFLCPQSNAQAGWKKTKPSYEEEYTPDAPLRNKSQFGQGFTFPCLFRVGNDGWVQVSETGVAGNYCASHLSDYGTDGYTIAFPMEGENQGLGSCEAAFSLPGSTPWRTITLGPSLKPIAETTIQYDVVEPLYEASQQYAPGRYTWSWLLWQDESMNWDDQITFTDLAAKMGYEYILVDALWDKALGREGVERLSRYAQSKGVSLLLWYNSNGTANNAPQGPVNCMNSARARDREMAWMKSIGVKGIKVDFFGGDKQETMRLYEDILYDANRYGIQVIFHGCTLPRGWERMFPNYVASEAVLASENLCFTQHHCDREGFELTMHPFCRTAVASVDWGGVIMNRRMSKDNKSSHYRRTGDIFEMATGITNQSTIQCVAIQPNNLSELPQFEIDWLKALPTTWDETRLLDGYPGRYVVMARRHGQDWYVAALNGTDAPIAVDLDLAMFGANTPLKLYVDTEKRQDNLPVAQLQSVKTDKKSHLKLSLQPMGGAIIQR